jgi:hypothetical protein
MLSLLDHTRERLTYYPERQGGVGDAKPVGAITHVLIGVPTTGYGIFIENMLTAAQMPMQKAA